MKRTIAGKIDIPKTHEKRSAERMNAKEGLRQAVFHTPWCVGVAVFLLLGTSPLAVGQETTNFQNRNSAIEAGVLSVVNAERTARRLSAVSGNELLHTAAQWMAEDMAARHSLDHTDSLQRDLATRLSAFGYDDPRLIAENIAEGQDSPTAVVNSWLQSPPHRAILLQPEAREAGVGHARNAQGRHYWVLDLGAPFNDR